MSRAPLPSPSNPARIEEIAGLAASFIEGRTAIYLSTPITSGPRFMRWHAEFGYRFDPASQDYDLGLKTYVIEPNCSHARIRAQQLRRTSGKIVINPAEFSPTGWRQDDFRYFWGKLIERYVDEIVFLDGWQFSSGCTYEFLVSTRTADTRVLDESGLEITRDAGGALIRQAILDLQGLGMSETFLRRIEGELRHEPLSQASDRFVNPSSSTPISGLQERREARMLFKDQILDELGSVANIAQFISFAPGEKIAQRYSRVSGFRPNHEFASVRDGIVALLETSVDHMVNVRSFRPENPTGIPLVYGLTTPEEVLDVIERKAKEGCHTIVNETIDVHDGGVSGVLLGDVLEFAPRGTPQAVERPGVCRLPAAMGISLLESVYGFRPALNFPSDVRVEFSLHPKRRGAAQEHTIIWEVEDVEFRPVPVSIRWPNNFSQFIGDKTFGLLLADSIGLPVPKTTAICRTVAPFCFGRETGTGEGWIRTCPSSRAPGKFTSAFGWRDPFELLAEEDAESTKAVASILWQEAVAAEYSGSTRPMKDGEVYVEGVHGRGDDFMLGKMGPDSLPAAVVAAVKGLYSEIHMVLGDAEFEWVYDGYCVWVVQLHRSEASEDIAVIYPGETQEVVRFEVAAGLANLRDLISGIEPGVGVVLVGDVGITSHFGDLLRASRIPSRVEATS